MAPGRIRSKHGCAPLLGVIVVLGSARAEAQDGGNDVCPAISVPADDVRDRYDDEGRLVHQLRLSQGRVVQEVAVSFRGDQAVARTEVTPDHRRIARTYFDDGRPLVAECYEDGQRVGYASYAYDADGRVVLIDKRTRVVPANAAASGAETWARETTHNTYDATGQLLVAEVRDGAGRVKSRTRSERPPLEVPIVLSLKAGGTYQSDTELYDFLGGLGIHRDPGVENYSSDPLEIALDATYRFNRASGVTSTDQTTLRLGVDYHYVLPRLTLFTFTATDRNLPANLRLNLELAVLGAKVDIVPPRQVQLDLSFAPVWNFRSIIAPDSEAPGLEETTSKLRGSLRARAGVRFEEWSLLNTFEFLPTLYGDDTPPEDDFWHRTIVRNTVSFEVKLSDSVRFHEVFKYTWDSSMRAQAECPDSDNPLCLGYAFSSVTALSLNLEL